MRSPRATRRSTRNARSLSSAFLYTLHVFVAASCGPQTGELTAEQQSLGTTPFRMLVVGDSVAWGQGLAHEHKYGTKLARFLEERLQRPVSMDLRAHSGATIAAVPEDDDPPAHGEVPLSAPSLMRQVADGGPEADFVVVHGGINDVGFKDVLLGDLDATRAAARASCGGSMARLLGQIVARHPNGRVLVMRYPRLVSPATSAGVRLGLLKDFLGAVGVSVPLEDGAQAFREECNAALDSAAAAINQSAPTGNGRPRVAVATLDWHDENALGAPAALLFGEGITDEVTVARAGACGAAFQEAIEGKRNSWPPSYCAIAATGHPNVAGAQRYFEGAVATLSAAGGFLDEWSPGWRGLVKPGRGKVSVSTLPPPAACVREQVTDAARCGKEIVQRVVQDAVLCGRELVSCGVEIIVDRFRCGERLVKDAVACGVDFVQRGPAALLEGLDCRCDKWLQCECKLPRTCSVALSCEVTKKCEVAKSCVVEETRARTCQVTRCSASP